MSHLRFFARFYRATLSRDKIASVTWRVAQLLKSRATPFPNRVTLYYVRLCRENAVNADWSILIYVTKLQCATYTVAYCCAPCVLYKYDFSGSSSIPAAPELNIHVSF